MLILDLETGTYTESDIDNEYSSYPDEVLDSEWTPMLAEIQSVQSSSMPPSKTPLEVINSALAELNKHKNLNKR